MNILADWKLTLPEKEAGKQQKINMSALAAWMPMPPEKEYV